MLCLPETTRGRAGRPRPPPGPPPTRTARCLRRCSRWTCSVHPRNHRPPGRTRSDSQGSWVRNTFHAVYSCMYRHHCSVCVSLVTGEQEQQGGQQERSPVLHVPSSAYYADTVLHSNLYILPILVKLIENKQKSVYLLVGINMEYIEVGTKVLISLAR